MTCHRIKPLLSEFTDERLEAGTAWIVQTHLAECADCAKIVQNIRAMQTILQALPAGQPSAQFDASLAQRLALVRRPERPLGWYDRLVRVFTFPMPLLRPILALGAAAMAVGALLLLPPQTVQRAAPLATPRATDRSLVANCVQQHRSEAAAEPLSDLSAQNLAGQIDTASVKLNISPTADESPL